MNRCIGGSHNWWEEPIHFSPMCGHNRHAVTAFDLHLSLTSYAIYVQQCCKSNVTVAGYSEAVTICLMSDVTFLQVRNWCFMLHHKLRINRGNVKLWITSVFRRNKWWGQFRKAITKVIFESWRYFSCHTWGLTDDRVIDLTRSYPLSFHHSSSPYPLCDFAALVYRWSTTTSYKVLCSFCYNYLLFFFFWRITRISSNSCILRSYFSIYLINKMAAAAILKNGCILPLLCFSKLACTCMYR